MATIFIEKIPNLKQGSTKYKVRCRALKNDPVSGQKTRTFSTLAKAIAFKNKLQTQFNQGNYSFFSSQVKHMNIGYIINDYLENPLTKKHVKKHQISPLKRISQTSIALVPAANLDAHHWYMLAMEMTEGWQIKPQTTANYLSILNSALKDSATILRYSINLDGYSNSVSTARRLGLITNSDERTRRPTENELTTILAALERDKENQRREIPMLDIVEFAIETAARLGEICGKKITWRDWDPDSRHLTIRNRKSPNNKKVTSCFELSPKAIEIIMNQPRGNDDDPIFPYNPKTVGQYWRELMKDLDIKDLRFHDLRAEGLCRLYDLGWNLPAISKVSGHRDINILNNIYLRFYPTQPSRLTE